MNSLIKIYLQTALVTLTVKLVSPVYGANENLLENYLPPTMQALAYYIDLLQYEPLAMTTVEPPFFAEDMPEDRTTTAMPTTTATTTTRKPASSWFQSPSWWASTTTTTVKPTPTHKHKPGLYSPYSADQLYSNQGNNVKNQVTFPFDSDAAFIRWLSTQKPRLDTFEEEEIDNNIVDFLPLSLTRDIEQELDKQNQHTEVENLDIFLRTYDDKYGKYNSQFPITGKKRIPPTKAYVEFLLMYDLLKRDAKAANLNKYEGYTEKMIEELYELSNVSAQRQLYTLFKKMLERKEIQRSDIVTRVQKMLKELGDGKSVVSKSLMYYPPLRFLP